MPFAWFGAVGLELFVRLLHEAPKLAVAAIGYAYIFRRERDGDRMAAVNLVLGTLIADCAISASYGSTSGILRPVLPFGAIELATLLVLVSLAARLHASYVRGRSHRTVTVPASAALWAFFLLWIAASAVRGLLLGNPRSLVIFEAQALVNVGGGALLVAGVPMEQLCAPRGLRRTALFTAPVALVLMVTSVVGIRKSLNLPFVPLFGAGGMGADASTVFATLAFFSIALSLASPRGRRDGFLAGVVLLAAPLAAEQRAALLGAAAGGVVFVGCLLLRRGRGLRLHPNEALVASLVLATVLSFGVVAGLATGGDQQLSQQIDKTFQSTAKRQSAQSRENQWAAAVDVVKEQPFLGHGLGVEFDHFEVGPNRIWRQDISHNIVLDVAMRAGLIGAAALLLALLVSLASGVAVAVRGRPMTAALALAATAALTGLVTKGMVESIFEKHRLALLLGLVLGVLWRAQITNRQQAKVPESRNAELARITSRTSPT